jgi:hypothetical protein
LLLTAGGRPSKLTDDLQKRLCDAIAAGNYRKPACKSVGIDYSTFLRWMQKGISAADRVRLAAMLVGRQQEQAEEKP